MVRTKILMSVVFGPMKGRITLAEELRDAGVNSVGIANFLADRMEHVAEVEIGADGIAHIISIRRMGKCPAVHESGEACSLHELHEKDEHVAITPIQNGMSIRRWKFNDT